MNSLDLFFIFSFELVKALNIDESLCEYMRKSFTSKQEAAASTPFNQRPALEFCRSSQCPKTLFEIAMALFTISFFFPPKSRFSATFSILLRFFAPHSVR